MIANDALFDRIQHRCDIQSWLPDEARYRANVTQRYALATEAQLLATEDALGFRLPSTLRTLYAHVANGGFGPGLGIPGALCGFSSIGLGGNIVKAYHAFIDNMLLVDYTQYKDESGTQTIFKFPSNVWSARLLPICDWGCSITSFLDIESGQVLRGSSVSRTSYILRPQAVSLEEWLEQWLIDE